MIRANIAGKEDIDIKEISVTKSIESVCGGFEIIVDKVPEGESVLSTLTETQIFIDDIPVILGFAEKYNGDDARNSVKDVYAGRDKTLFLITNDIYHSININNLKGINTLDQFIRELLSANGINFIKVINSTNQTLKLDANQISVDVGDNLFEVIRKYCYLNNVVCTSDYNGNISLERAGLAGGKRAQKKLFKTRNINDSNNILESQMSMNMSERYGTYMIISQENTSGKNLPSLETLQKMGSSQDINNKTTMGIAVDPIMNPKKVKVTVVDKQANPDFRDKMAIWEMNMGIMKSFEYYCTVSGFRSGEPDANGNQKDLWRPNMIVSVKDDKYGINSDMLITTTTFIQSKSQGYITKLKLTYPDAFTLTDRPSINKTRSNELLAFRLAKEWRYYEDKDITKREFTQQQYNDVWRKPSKKSLVKVLPDGTGVKL